MTLLLCRYVTSVNQALLGKSCKPSGIPTTEFLFSDIYFFSLPLSHILRLMPENSSPKWIFSKSVLVLALLRMNVAKAWAKLEMVKQNLPSFFVCS